MKKYFSYILFFIFLGHTVWSQEKKIIRIIHSDFIDMNQTEIPGAILFTGNVQVEHDGVLISCNKAYHFKDENYVKAFGNVRLNQGDTITMASKYAEYNGNQKFAFATGDVVLRSPESTLTTDTINFDRSIQQAYYNTYGTIINKENTLRSKSGRYFLNEKKYQFKTAVTVTSPESNIKTNHLDYYENSGHAYVFGPSTINNKGNIIYTENGFYDTKNQTSNLSKNSTITYQNRKIKGEKIYYDGKRNFSSATNNVKITDSINRMVVTGHYAEMHRAKDSMFITKKALIASFVENDSVYIHAEKLLVTGKQGNRIVRGFKNSRIFKSDMSGKCDSIHSDQTKGLTQMIGRPVLWSQNSQLTGDIMHLIGNNKTEKLDSLKVINNAFIIQKDTVGNGFNQVKGLNLYGKFRDNKLYEVDMVKNAEIIYYMYNDTNELIGINKGVASNIHLELEENKIQTATLLVNPDSQIYPEKELPENARKLRGFIWRGDEEIKRLEDIFSKEEMALDVKAQSDSKKNAQEAEKPMEIKKETLEYGKPVKKVTTPVKKKKK